MQNLEKLNCDLVEDIVSRLDGLSLSSFASTSSQLRPVALHSSLWENLCHSTWPSTKNYPISPSFRKFFSDLFPKLYYDEISTPFPENTPPTLPSNFMSFIDVFYKNDCVFSTVVRGIPEISDFLPSKKDIDAYSKFISEERWKWFLNCPFKLNILHLAYDEDEDEEEGEDDFFDDNNISDQFSTPLTSDLMEDVRLSWILLDNKTGKSVNLSTWKPISVQSVWPHKEDFTMQFGSIIPVDETVLPEKLARISITTKFKLTGKKGCLQWREISLSVEDLKGVLVDGKTSLAILGKALYCLRTTDRVKVENGFNRYEEKKAEMHRRNEVGEVVTNGMYICIQIAIFAILCNNLVH